MCWVYGCYDVYIGLYEVYQFGYFVDVVDVYFYYQWFLVCVVLYQKIGDGGYGVEYWYEVGVQGCCCVIFGGCFVCVVGDVYYQWVFCLFILCLGEQGFLCIIYLYGVGYVEVGQDEGCFCCECLFDEFVVVYFFVGQCDECCVWFCFV